MLSPGAVPRLPSVGLPRRHPGIDHRGPRVATGVAVVPSSGTRTRLPAWEWHRLSEDAQPATFVRLTEARRQRVLRRLNAVKSSCHLGVAVASRAVLKQYGSDHSAPKLGPIGRCRRIHDDLDFHSAEAFGEWCNGSTTGSEPVSLGSNPSSPVLQRFPPKNHPRGCRREFSSAAPHAARPAATC